MEYFLSAEQLMLNGTFIKKKNKKSHDKKM